MIQDGSLFGRRGSVNRHAQRRRPLAAGVWIMIVVDLLTKWQITSAAH
jgi:hypothetical protein